MWSLERRAEPRELGVRKQSQESELAPRSAFTARVPVQTVECGASAELYNGPLLCEHEVRRGGGRLHTAPRAPLVIWEMSEADVLSTE